MRLLHESKPLPLAAIVTVGLCLMFPAPGNAAGTRVSAQFSLSREDLQEMTSALPRRLQDRILARPKDFLQMVGKVLDEPADFVLLVDKRHPLPSDYAPPDLVRLHKDYNLDVPLADVSVRKAIMPAVLEMTDAARADGVTLVFSSGYRSYEYQISVYAREVKMYGKETADRESAQAGMSQHQLGTAIDFGSITNTFADTRAGKWIAAHAWEYGFSLSYPRGYEELTGYRYESWHYRYITRAGTLIQREFFDDVQQYLVEFLHQNRAVLEAKRLPQG
jgi:D-alanyl-D-alanine carboxypeptidase